MRQRSLHVMTSASVIIYKVFKDGVLVRDQREHMLCKSRLYELLQFIPLEDYTIQATGLDEHEAPWEDEPENLADFLKRRRVSITPRPTTPNI